MKNLLGFLAVVLTIGCGPSPDFISARTGSPSVEELEAVANDVQGATRYYFRNNLAPGSIYHGELNTTAPSPALTATGWTVGTKAANQWSLQDFQTERSSSTFDTGLPQYQLWHPASTPVGAPNLGHCWRTPALTAGTTAVEWWYLFVEVQAQSSGGSQDGLIEPGLALVRGTDPDGVNPVLGISDFPTSQAINLQTFSPWQVLTSQFYPGQLSIQDGDYLYLCLSWKITGPGTSNSKDVRLRVGGNTWLQMAAIQ